MPEFIFTMKDLRKVVPPKREILKGIWLSFFHGAKIGVLGQNGAGKSSLLRIMAGQDKEFDGEAFPSKTATVGYLAQEPQLDPAKTVLENVQEAVSETTRLLDRFNAVSDKFAEPLEPDEMEKLLAEQAKLQEKVTASERAIEKHLSASEIPEPLVELFEKRIRPMNQKTFDAQTRKIPRTRFQWLLIPGFLCLFFAFVDRERRRS